jgi:predicted DNA binding CopG/RHH family protein
MGRKKVPEELHLHVSATCRMTIEELDAVRAAARNAGLTNSKFLRSLIQKHVVLQTG